MASILMGAEALTVVRLRNGSRVNIHKGGVVPASADPDDVKRLLEEKYLKRVELIDPDKASDADSKEPTVKEILAEVGDDKDKAAEALKAEQAKGDKARSSLVEKLQAIVSPS